MNYTDLNFFKGFTLEEITPLVRMMIPVTYAANETILQENEVSQVLMLILRGQAKVVKKIDDHNSKFISILETGDVFGEMSFFDESKHNATVIAHTDMNLLALSKKDFHSFIEKNPKVAIRLLIRVVQVCSQRVRNLNEELKQMGAWCISLRDTKK